MDFSTFVLAVVVFAKKITTSFSDTKRFRIARPDEDNDNLALIVLDQVSKRKHNTIIRTGHPPVYGWFPSVEPRAKQLYKLAEAIKRGTTYSCYHRYTPQDSTRMSLRVLVFTSPEQRDQYEHFHPMVGKNELGRADYPVKAFKDLEGLDILQPELQVS